MEIQARVDVNPTNHFIFVYKIPKDIPVWNWELVELYHFLKLDSGADIVTNCYHMIPMMRSSGWFSFLMTMIENKIKSHQYAEQEVP